RYLPTCLFLSHVQLRVLHSFPTRRSSDLVLEVLSTKEYNDQKWTAYYEKFQEIREGATRCNNISTLRSYADKADALKLRLLNEIDRKSTRLNSSHVSISYAVFCLKKKK